MARMEYNSGATRARRSRTLGGMSALTRLHDLRLHQALSQEDLAKLSGVDRTTIIRLEGGEPNPRPSTIRKLARALRVKPTELR